MFWEHVGDWSCFWDFLSLCANSHIHTDEAVMLDVTCPSHFVHFQRFSLHRFALVFRIAQQHIHSFILFAVSRFAFISFLLSRSSFLLTNTCQYLSARKKKQWMSLLLSMAFHSKGCRKRPTVWNAFYLFVAFSTFFFSFAVCRHCCCRWCF